MAEVDVPTGLEVEVTQLEHGAFGKLEGEWRALEERAAGSPPYAGFDWLLAWSEAYVPQGPAVLRVTARDGGTVALGLMEQRSGGRWTFAGAPITSERGLLCANGLETDTWESVSSWLRAERRSWATLDCEAAPPAARSLPGAQTTEVSVLRMDLPDTFDAYMSTHNSKRRWALKRKLQTLEEAGGTVQRAESPSSGLEKFVHLHQQRARAKGERHPQIDERLAQMLESLAGAGSLELIVDEVDAEGRTLGVTVHLAYRRCMYSYNIGIDTSVPGISPGLVLELAAIRDTIERGYERFDFGTGYYKYKEELGGVPVERFSVVSTSPNFRGVALSLSLAALRRGRSLTGRRHLARFGSLLRRG